MRKMEKDKQGIKKTMPTFIENEQKEEKALKCSKQQLLHCKQTKRK